MDPHDLPKKMPGLVIGENLDAISLSELEQRVEVLESEMARLKVEITRKRASKSAADAFFRS